MVRIQRATLCPLRLKLHRVLCDGEGPGYWIALSVSRLSAGSESCGGFSGMSRLSPRWCGQKCGASWLVPSCRRWVVSSPITVGAAETNLFTTPQSLVDEHVYKWTRVRREARGLSAKWRFEHPVPPKLGTNSSPSSPQPFHSLSRQTPSAAAA